MCLCVCAKLNFAVFLEVNGGPCNECSQRNCAGNNDFDGERVGPENGVFHHAVDNSVWEFMVEERAPSTADPFFHHVDLSLNLWDVFIGCGSVESESLVS